MRSEGRRIDASKPAARLECEAGRLSAGDRKAMVSDAPRVVPLHNPSVAETISVLAAAMGFMKPAAHTRRHAGRFPVEEKEQAEALALYSRIKAPGTRQAILDALVAVTASPEP